MVSFGFSRNEWLAYQMGRRVSEALDRAPEMGWHVDQPSCRPPSVGWWLGDHLHRIHLTLKQRHWELRPVQQRKQSHTYDPAVGARASIYTAGGNGNLTYSWFVSGSSQVSNVSIGPSGPHCDVSVTATMNQTGSVTVGCTVSDGQSSTTAYATNYYDYFNTV